MNDSEIYKARERYEKMLQAGTREYFEPEELEYVADSYEEEMAYTQALQAITYGLQMYPSNEGLLMHKARCLLTFNRIEDAMHTLSGVVNKNIEYYFVLCEIELRRNEKAAAKQSIENIIALPDCTIEDCIDILDMCADLNQQLLLEDIVPIIERTFEDTTPFLREMALLYEEMDCDDKAITYYDKLLDINPYSVDDWFALAKVYARNKSYEKALDSCDYALAIDESNEHLVAFKGYCYYDNGQYAEAIEQFEMFQNLTSDKSVAYGLIAEAYSRMDKHEEAIAYLEKAIALDDRNHDYYYQIAVNHYYMGEKTVAMMYLKKAIACDMTDDDAHVLLGELMYQEGVYEEAYEHLKYIKNQQLVDTASMVAFSELCAHLSRYDEAAEWLEILLEREPYEPRYMFNLIICYSCMGETEKCKQLLEQIEAIACNDEILHTLDKRTCDVWKNIQSQIDELRILLRDNLGENI